MINFETWLNNLPAPFVRKVEEKVLKKPADSKSQKEQKIIFCAFCGKSQNEVCNVIQLDTGKTICNECVVVWNKSLSDTYNN